MLVAVTYMTSIIKKMYVPWHQNEAAYATGVGTIHVFIWKF